MSDVTSAVRSTGILPVINFKKAEWIDPLCKAFIDAGIKAVEVLFRSTIAVDVLKTVKAKYPELYAGAGTVLTLEQAQQAIDAGADFIVCPGYSQKLVDFCNEKGILIVPGCTSASEIQNAYASGLRVLKFFPAEMLGGTAAMKELGSPFSGVEFIPTNGIKFDNLDKYMQDSRVIACGGSFMAPYDLLEAGKFDEVAALCKKAVDIAVGFKLAHVGINCEGDEDAFNTANALCALFGFQRIEHRSSIFAGAAVECMRNGGFGTKGHIGIRTYSIDRALAYLNRRGVEYLPGSEKYDAAGKLNCIYLKNEIAGFAIHIVK